MSGLYVSQDEGENWQPAYQSLALPQPPATLAVAVPPNYDQQPASSPGAAAVCCAP